MNEEARGSMHVAASYSTNDQDHSPHMRNDSRVLRSWQRKLWYVSALPEQDDGVV